MTKEERIIELVNKYLEWDKKDNKSTDIMSCIARDEKRSIKTQFKKEMHEDIKNFLKKG